MLKRPVSFFGGRIKEGGDNVKKNYDEKINNQLLFDGGNERCSGTRNYRI